MPVGDGQPDKSMEEQLRDGSHPRSAAAVLSGGRAARCRRRDDPGRVRNRAFFDKMYGDCKAGEVAPKLVRVVWLPTTWGHTISVTSVNGVDRQLAAISRELDELPAGATRSFSIRSAAPMFAAPSPIPARPACMPGARRSTSTRRIRITGCGTGAGGDLPAYVNRIPPEIVDDIRAARLHLGRPMGAFRHDALRIPAGIAPLRPRNRRRAVAGACSHAALACRRWPACAVSRKMHLPGRYRSDPFRMSC